MFWDEFQICPTRDESISRALKCYARNAGELLSERLINWIVNWPAEPSFGHQRIHLTWFDWRSHINELCDVPHADSPQSPAAGDSTNCLVFGFQ